MSLLGDANNALTNRKNGVTVYNPTPQAAPAAPAPVQPAGQSRWSDFVASNFQTPTQKEEEEGNQNGRGLGFIVNNPVTRGILQPIDWLDRGRRLGVFGVETLAEALPQNVENMLAISTLGMAAPVLGVDEAKTRSDTRSFRDKMGDPTYGYGQIAHSTGNKWGDRAVGLGGDILLDPLTYVAGIGFADKAGAAGGKAARLRLGIKAMDAAADLPDAAKAARLAEIQTMTEKGLGRASPQLLDDLGVRGGIRIGLTPSKSITIKGSEKLTRPLSAARGAVGERIVKTRVGGKLSRIRVPADLEAAYAKLFYGENTMSTKAALTHAAIENVNREAQGAFAHVANRELRSLYNDMRKMTPTERATLLDETELADHLTELNKAFDYLWEKAAKTVNDTEVVGWVDRARRKYSAHIVTRDAKDWLREASPEAEEFKKLNGLITENMYEPSGITMARRFVPGETVQINGIPVKIENGSVNELNRRFRQAGLDFDFYEHDPGVILEKYINMLSSDVGLAMAVADRAKTDPTGLFTLNRGREILADENGMGGAKALVRGTGLGTDDAGDLAALSEKVGIMLDPEIYEVIRAQEMRPVYRKGGKKVKRRKGLAVEKPVDLTAEYNATVTRAASAKRSRIVADRGRLLDKADNAVGDARRTLIDGLNEQRRVARATIKDRSAVVQDLQQKLDEGIRVQAGRSEPGVAGSAYGATKEQLREWIDQIDSAMQDWADDIKFMDDALARDTATKGREYIRDEMTALRSEFAATVQRTQEIGRHLREGDVLSSYFRNKADELERRLYADVDKARAEYEAALAAYGPPPKLPGTDTPQPRWVGPDIRTSHEAEQLKTYAAILNKHDNEVVRMGRLGDEHYRPLAQSMSRLKTATIPGVYDDAGRLKQVTRAEARRWMKEHAEEVKFYDRIKSEFERISAKKPIPAAVPANPSKVRRPPVEPTRMPPSLSLSTSSDFVVASDGTAIAPGWSATAVPPRAQPEIPSKLTVRGSRGRFERAQPFPPPYPHVSTTHPTNPTGRAKFEHPVLKAKREAYEAAQLRAERLPTQAALDVGNTTPNLPLGREMPTYAPEREADRAHPDIGAMEELQQTRRAALQAEVGAPAEAERNLSRIDALRDDIHAMVQDPARREQAIVTGQTTKPRRAGFREDPPIRVAQAGPRANAQRAQEFGTPILEARRADFVKKLGEVEQAEATTLLNAHAAASDVQAAVRTRADAETLLKRIYDDPNVKPYVEQAAQVANRNTPEGRLVGAYQDLAHAMSSQATATIGGETVTRSQARAWVKANKELVDSFADTPAVMGVTGKTTKPTVRMKTDDFNAGIAAQANELKTVLGWADDAAVDLPDEVVAMTTSLLNDATQATVDLGKNDLSLAQFNDLLKRGRKEQLGHVISAKVRDANYVLFRPELFGDQVLAHRDIQQALERVRMAAYDKDFWPVLDTFTNLFKTYATLTPGFHMRNGMSAIFVNSSDGVPMAQQGRGVRLFRQYLKSDNPEAWMAAQGKKVLNEKTGLTVQDAFTAAMGSGIGGRYFERGVGDRATLRYRTLERLFDNPATRALGHGLGGSVEGAVRLPVALDTLARGGTVQDAMARITRLHFDYSQVSKFDERAKRMIPFWTFMSRNLPMQITQMWTQPRTYAKYRSFIRNFSVPDEPNTPDYFGDIGAFNTPFELGGLPMYLQPDFAHTRIDEDYKKLEDLLSLKNPTRAFTDFNPLFTAPLEFGTKKDFYTGRTYDDTDLRATGTLEKPIELLGRALGLGETAQGERFTEERLIDAVRSLVPLYDRSVRLAPGAVTDNAAKDATSRQLESFLRFLGLPVRQLSPEQQRATQRSARYDKLDAKDLQAALQRLLREQDAA